MSDPCTYSCDVAEPHDRRAVEACVWVGVPDSVLVDGAYAVRITDPVLYRLGPLPKPPSAFVNLDPATIGVPSEETWQATSQPKPKPALTPEALLTWDSVRRLELHTDIGPGGVGPLLIEVNLRQHEHTLALLREAGMLRG